MSHLQQVRVGMRVVDSLGQDVGAVDQVNAGDGGPITTHGRHGLPDWLSRAVGREPHTHPQTAARMLRAGYVRVRRNGVLPTHAYAAADQIHAVTGSTAQLSVTATELLTG